MGVLDLGKVVGPQGKQGDPGRDGTDGTPGAPGTPGADGKSAYQYAKEGGFVGTEEQFYTALAEVVLKMNKVIPQKVDSIATLSAAGQVQDSGKTLANLATAEQIANVYTKKESDAKYAGKDTVYTKNDTMTAETGKLIGSGVTTPDLAFQKLKELINALQSAADAKLDVVTGSYTGTGKYGSANPTKIAFESEPALLLIKPDEAGYGSTYNYLGVTFKGASVLWSGSTRNDESLSKSYADGQLSFYSTQDEALQLNFSSIKYSYIALVQGV